MNQAATKAPDSLPSARRRQAHRRWRTAKDAAARGFVGVGGIGVIIAVLLIFVYLLYVVAPLFDSSSVDREASYPVPGSDRETLAISIEEQNRVGMRLARDGNVVFFNAGDGSVRQRLDLPLPADARITATARAGADSTLLAVGLSNGQALIVRHDYKVTYPDGVKTVTAGVSYPYGRAPVVVDAEGNSISELALAADDSSATLVGLTAGGGIALTRYARRENMLTGEVTVTPSHRAIESLGAAPESLALSGNQDWLYAAEAGGTLGFYDLRGADGARLVERFRAVDSGTRITRIAMLLGSRSLLVADDRGGISQYFPVRDDDNRYRLSRVRGFEPMPAAVTALEMEQRRRGFIAADADGNLGIYHSTANKRVVLHEAAADGPVETMALSPRTDRLFVESGGALGLWSVDNEHPEVSWSSIWGKVWYEGYDEPEWIWQSSASSSDFEPKFSLTPLTFGTLKGALYAMLFAVPLAIMGAIYTANFMAPEMRRVVKPTIEIMEALPTVILGFLAGLWMAPYVEKHLAGVLILLLFMPFGLLLFGWTWSRLPRNVRRILPPGWRPVLMIPAVLLIGWATLALGPLIESLFFGGDMRQWLTNDMGIAYDQRNALVVGFAMGFAVIPTIFSIAEDSIFSVPKALSHGSLALGATPWQTLTRVVMPTASPGIFSALMIGLGRAVGETMIVLMATGNTPIMDINIFEGMRTLSANIAVELPESEVGSSHYRILFLAALVLFLFTFVVNTGAEIIRQRLRRKYGQL